MQQYIYNETHLEKKEISIDDLIKNEDVRQEVQWINIDTKADKDILEKIGTLFNIHHLVIEDLLTKEDPPKVELFDDHVFILLKMLQLNNKNQAYFENVGMVLFKNTLITFQDGIDGDVFSDVRNRLENNIGKIRKNGADYLTWRLLDAIVKKYHTVLEINRQHIEQIEEGLMAGNIKNPIQSIIKLKQQLNILRKYIAPLKDETALLTKSETNGLIQKQTISYFRDITDHLSNINHAFDSYREMLRDLIELHNSNLSQNMNVIMKTLTVVSSIFIPLTFIVGVYGMNFDYMPELRYKYAYPILLFSMFSLTIGLLFYMRKRKWL